ncbi:AAA family ATPase [Nocardioides sp. AN3]
MGASNHGRSPRPADEQYVELRETHSAVVLLVGDRAWKLKKPVDLGFLDFSTPERREASCRREVELNRRLAPDVYQGVGEVRDAQGRTLEHLVLMRRMPSERRLARLVVAGLLGDADLWAVARSVADFHTRCDAGPAVAAEGTRDAVAHRWRDNLRQSRRFRGTLLGASAFDEVERLSGRFLDGREALFADRIARGAVVDGHGDLLADDIFCLPDGPRILDCLDFDDALRHLDRLDDVACLAMDLERLGAPDAARAFCAHYLELSGDPGPVSLLNHYIAYRAFMRAKVTCLRADDDRTRSDAATLTCLALHHLRESAVALVLVGGAPGTGKSTAAAALADDLGAVHLSSDRLRKELAGITPTARGGAAFQEGIYTPSWTERTYRELLDRAARLLAMGETVILDATWSQQGRRDEAAAVASCTSSDLVQLQCTVSDDVAESRLATRPAGVSDADVEVARAMRARFEAWPEATRVQTAQALSDTVRAMRHRVRPAAERAE